MRKFEIILAVILLILPTVTTSYWAELNRAVTHEGTYQDKRIEFAFNGLPVDSIGHALNSTRGPTASFRLSEGFQHNDFVKQRLSEALYPHLIDSKSDAIVELDASRKFILNGSLLNANEQTDDLDFSISLAIASIISSFGFGVCIWPFVFRRTAATTGRGIESLASVFILGAICVGLIESIATWSQISIAPYTLWLIGLVLAPVGISALWRTRTLRTTYFDFRSPSAESCALIAVVALFVLQVAIFPVTLWDGRSIWLFHAKQIFINGMMPRTDILRPDLLWSHPDYPYFFPSWLAFFSGGNTSYNERMASFGIAVLFSSLSILLWTQARRELGRWQGSIVAICSSIIIARATAGGYLDGILMICLLTQYFSLSSKELNSKRLGWILALLASCLKTEGLVFSLIVALFTRFEKQEKSYLKGFAVFLPALVHQAWIRSLGIDSIHKGTNWSASLDNCLSRSYALLLETPRLFMTPGYLQIRGILVAGLLGAIFLVALMLTYRRLPRSIALMLLAVLTMSSFVYLSLSLLPEDIHWFAQVTLDRLLLHPAALLMAAPFVYSKALRSPEKANAY